MLIFCCLFCMIIFEGGTDTCIYAESGAVTVLKCPITKNVNKMQWSYINKSGKVVISDNNETNPELEEKSKFMVVENILDEVYELSITNVSKSDEKTYICWTQSIVNTTSTTANSSVEKIKFTLYLKQRPSQLLLADPVLNNTIDLVENLEITISCSSVDGVPRPNVSWIYHPDIFVTESNDIGWSNITFTPTRHYNEQVFICKAVYDMVPISLNETVILNVLYKPVITVTRRPKGVVFLDETVTLYCVSNSNPITTNITWKRDDGFLTKNSNHTIYNASINDSGLFVCEVTNDIGTAIGNISIDITEYGSFPTTLKTLVNVEISNLPSILIYLIVCCFAVVIITTTAKLYTCLKLGKLRCIKKRRQNLNTLHLNQQNTLQDANTDHYTEIEL